MARQDSWAGRTRQGLGRRRLLKGVAGGAGGLAGLAFVACGGGSDKSDKSVGSGAATAAGGTAAAAGKPKRGGTLRIAANASPPTLDPFKTASSYTRSYSGGVYSTLFNPKGVPADQFPSFELTPDAAESYEVTGDGLQYTVKLRKNVKYQPPVDRLMTAEDVVYSFDRFLGKAGDNTPAPNIDQFDMLDSVSAPDASTVVFKLKRPFATFVSRLADEYNVALMPKETGTAFDPSKTMVGSGPWVMVENVPSQSTKFRRFADWHLGPERPYIDTIDVSVVPQFATQLNQYLAGNIDTIALQGSDDILRARDQVKGGDLRSQLPTYMGYVGFSGNEPNAPWKDPRVRHAVSMALDRDAMFEALYDAKKLTNAGLKVQARHHNLIPAGLGKYWLDPTGDKIDAKVKPFFKYDPEGAKRLLAEAGYKDGFTANYHYTITFGERYKLCAELVPQYLSKVGIKLNTIVDDYASAYVTKTFRGDFDGLAFLYQGFPQPDDYLTSMYTPGASRNHSKVNDAPLVARINDIQATRDDAQRTQKILDIQNYLGEQMYYVPAVYDSGPIWNGSLPQLKDSANWLTSRSGGYSVGYSHWWLDR